MEEGSEIWIEKEDDDTFLVTIDNKFFITTTSTERQDTMGEWIRETQAIYGKKNKKGIIVGLSATSKENYANSGGYWRRRSKDKGKEKPYDLLQLCVGNHCLLVDMTNYSYWRSPAYTLPKVMWS
ncbi:hypothetical protein COLO4_06773 [Corchorus olitorius]|uniref:Uncharacterized protein n=1 Tax=Corchorus olitorius TaxID=93759 RepID=A0A1R3KLZ9_9ROSI|nr:hypothetical protein COLO4_06773 [Corchorus olitorius]